MGTITNARAQELTIGELSELTAVNIETIRYYERIRMLPAPPRTPGGRRVFVCARTRAPGHSVHCAVDSAPLIFSRDFQMTGSKAKVGSRGTQISNRRGDRA
jgi:hypothetical protein